MHVLVDKKKQTTAKTPKRVTVTAALPYANGPIHIGHMAGVYLPADIYVRYLRKKGTEVLFVSGSDEGGAAITLQAHQQNTTPKALVSVYHKQIHQTLKASGIAFDVFDRTSSPTHHQLAQAFFKKLYEKGVLLEEERLQFYDVEAKLFLADRYLRGICPNCQAVDAYGDQCEACGSSINAEDLEEPRSVVSGSKPIQKQSKHWYFPLQNYADWLKKWILEEHTEWKPNVYGQCKSWLEKGLAPRAITRDIDWGVPVPLKQAKGKVLYVWFEAPIGYISATQSWGEKTGEAWEPFWKDKHTRLVHFIGKDNIVFHCIIFPAMLKAHGNYILPEAVVANEFLLLEGKKISTSRGHAVWVKDYIKAYPDKVDVLRYVLCANAPEQKDGNFTWADFVAKNNSDLVGTLGNLIHRTQVLLKKICYGVVPEKPTYTALDQRMITTLQAVPEAISVAIERYKFKKALGHWMDIAHAANKYLAEAAPWKVVKTNPKRAQDSLYVVMQMLGCLAILGEPFLPGTCQSIQKALQIEGNPLQKVDEVVAPGTRPKQMPLYFEKMELSTVQARMEKVEQGATDQVL